jgi:N-acetylmuramoyl-L-alanine amidase
VYQSPLEKARIANATGADYFVSLHRNSNEIPNAHNGIMTLVYQQNPTVDALAHNINAQLEAVGFANLGIDERPGLVVLRRTQMPAILVEVGFINSDYDNQLFDQKFEQIINAIAMGIEKGLGELGVDPPGNPQPSNPLYGVQTGLFRHQGNARFMMDELTSLGYTARIRREEPFFAVVVGEEPSLEMAAALQRHLRSRGFDTLVVRL